MLINDLFYKHLVTLGLLDEITGYNITKVSNENETLLYQDLIKNKVLNEEDVYKAIASFMGKEYRDFELTEVNFDLCTRFPREKMIEYQVMPYEENDERVLFAISNPFRIEELNEFKSVTDKKLDVFFTEQTRMAELITYMDNKLQQSSVLTEANDENAPAADDETNNISIDAPVVKLCDSILKDAVIRKASDIHIEPFTNEVLVRYRIDGKLTVIDHLSPILFQSIVARFKIMAEMNIAERRIPQDGKISLTFENNLFDFRVSTIPTINGEKIVIRIYNITLSTSELSSLGFNKHQSELIHEMITRPHGIILLTGPTGSGKSTSLYAFLRFLNTHERNIITVEDPVENQIDGINQVQVNPKANLTFASALRSILRQDPNIIMIGEIRDEETAQIATRAAITGHLVLSTIHTNDAVGVVARLINMGIPPYLVADSLLGSVSQRLVRKLCPVCKKEHITTPAEMEMLKIDKPRVIYEAVGCKACNMTGYQGRTGVFEILVNDDKIREAIMSNTYTSDKLNELVRNTMPSIMDNAKERVLNGETSISEFEELNENVRKQVSA